jgi:ABC-type oligopeptide transport system substrate-binding subunit
MKVRLSLLSLALVLSTFGAVLVPSAAVSAHEEGEAETTTATVISNVKEDEPHYDYQAQQGDSYTKMARKAVQTYGVVNKIDLSGAKIVYAETNLTLEAGSPQLNLGQGVAISEASVKAWVEKAMAITAEEEAAWNHYVQFVDFNTNNVGEARS